MSDDKCVHGDDPTECDEPCVECAHPCRSHRDGHYCESDECTCQKYATGQPRLIKSEILTQEQIDQLDGTILFDPDSLDRAIIAAYKLPNGEHIAVYDYDVIVDEYAKMFSDESSNEEEAHDEAIQWVDYNTCRSVPYMGARSPLIVRKRFEDEEEDPDERHLELAGEKWVVVECTHDLPEFQPHSLTDTLVQESAVDPTSGTR